jgi:UDP-GlcNAc:undecaprenyl-phosphate/decaprenyl-phosphate GlcNAc-1-phosphate transferase
MYLPPLLFFSVLLTGLTVSVAANYFLLGSKIAKQLADSANERSLHVGIKPRTGGLAIASGLAASGILCTALFRDEFASIYGLAIAYFSLLALSLLDDAKSLRPFSRLAVQLGIIFTWFTFELAPQLIDKTVFFNASGVIFTVAAVLAIAWATNLFNFMDGSDGLAGSMACVGFATYAIVCFLKGDHQLTYLCSIVFICTFGFLIFNWPPSRLFLGDSGSIPLGFLAAAIGAIGIARGHWSISFPLMLFSMFWIDATYTLVKRALGRRKFWQSHNEHWYQKAIRSGSSHKKVVLVHLVCNVLIAFCLLQPVLFSRSAPPTVHILTIVMCLSFAFGFGLWAELAYRQSSTKPS